MVVIHVCKDSPFIPMVLGHNKMFRITQISEIFKSTCPIAIKKLPTVKIGGYDEGHKIIHASSVSITCMQS